MADLETRDLTPKDEGPYLVPPRTQLDLEARLDEGYVSDFAVQTYTVNPNPLGSETDEGVYVGTDPIYQNDANGDKTPYDAQEGVEKQLEDQLKANNDLSDLSDKEVAEDFGLGGKARLAGSNPGGRFRTVLPGQEGYDKAKAEEQQCPPLVVFLDDDEDDESEGEVTQANDPGTNLGASMQPPTVPSSPEDSEDSAGNKPARAPRRNQSDN